MKHLIVVLAGALIWFTLLSVHWSVAMLTVMAPMAAFLVWCRPEHSLYCFFPLVIMSTDSMAKDVDGIFAIKDVKIVQGLPPLLITLFLAMSLLYFFKFYLLEHKRSIIPVKYGAVLVLILFIATGTGLLRGWDHIDVRVDFMDVFLPLLCFYLCVNILDTTHKIYTMLGVLFITSIIDATLLDVYYLCGHGWPYSDEVGLGNVVTLDAADLMVFVAMVFTIYSASVSGALTGSRRVLALIGCLPLVFAILFSFRRSIWLGSVSSLIVLLYFLSPALEGGKRRAWTWAGLVMLAIALPFAGTVASTDTVGLFVTRALSLADSSQSSNQHHLLESQQTLKEVLSSSPFLGLGLGSTHAPVLDIGWAPAHQPTRIVHDAYLLIWMRLGLFGLLFVIWLSGKYIAVVLRYRRGTALPHPIIAGTGSQLGIWLVVLVSGPVLPYWHQTFTITLFAAMTLLLIRLERVRETNNTIAHSLR